MKTRLLILCAFGMLFLSHDLYALRFESDREIFKIGEDMTVPAGERVSKALVLGGDAYVDGMVMQDVVAIGGSVFMGPQSQVGGNVTVVGGSIVKQEGAHVGGSLTTLQTPDIRPMIKLFSTWDLPAIMPRILEFSGVMHFIGLIFIAILVVAVMPETVGHVSAMVEHNLMGSIFWGMLTLIMVVPVGIMLLISLIGVVLIPLELIFVICCGMLGYIAAAHLVGKKIWLAMKRSDQSIMFETILGFLALFAISWVPFVGLFILSMLIFLGFGGVMAGMMARKRTPPPI